MSGLLLSARSGRRQRIMHRLLQNTAQGGQKTQDFCQITSDFFADFRYTEKAPIAYTIRC